MERTILPSSSYAFIDKVLRACHKPGFLAADEGAAITLAFVEQMADDKVDSSLLKFASRFFTPQDYEDVVTERNISHLCGYPLCDSDPKGLHKQHQINYRRPSLILPATYLSKYCCRQHYQSSLFYKHQLSEQSVFSRKDIGYVPYGGLDYEANLVLLEEVIATAEEQNKTMESIIMDFKSLSVEKQATGLAGSVQELSDPDFIRLTEQVKSMRLRERDPKKAYIDAYNAPMEQSETNEIEGYSSSLR